MWPSVPFFFSLSTGSTMFSDTETLQQNDVVTTIPPTPLLMPRSHPIPPLLMPFHQRTRILCSVDWKKRYFKRKGGKYCHSRWWMAPKTRGKACGKLWCDSNKISLVCSPKRLLLIISETLSVRTRYYLCLIPLPSLRKESMFHLWCSCKPNYMCSENIYGK